MFHNSLLFIVSGPGSDSLSLSLGCGSSLAQFDLKTLDASSLSTPAKKKQKKLGCLQSDSCKHTLADIEYLHCWCTWVTEWMLFICVFQWGGSVNLFKFVSLNKISRFRPHLHLVLDRVNVLVCSFLWLSPTRYARPVSAGVSVSLDRSDTLNGRICNWLWWFSGDGDLPCRL